MCSTSAATSREKRCNLGSVDLEPVVEATGRAARERSRHSPLRNLTAAARAKWILENWCDVLPRFIKVFPHEFKRVLGVSRNRAPYIPVEPIAASPPPSMCNMARCKMGKTTGFHGLLARTRPAPARHPTRQ